MPCWCTNGSEETVVNVIIRLPHGPVQNQFPHVQNHSGYSQAITQARDVFFAFSGCRLLPSTIVICQRMGPTALLIRGPLKVWGYASLSWNACPASKGPVFGNEINHRAEHKKIAKKPLSCEGSWTSSLRRAKYLAPALHCTEKCTQAILRKSSRSGTKGESVCTPAPWVRGTAAWKRVKAMFAN